MVVDNAGNTHLSLVFKQLFIRQQELVSSDVEVATTQVLATVQYA